MAQQVKTLAVKLNNLSLISRTYVKMDREKQLQNAVLCLLYMCYGNTHTPQKL